MSATSKATEYTIHADGACKGNPGLGGWGALIDYPGAARICLNGFAADTTNNRMELSGLIAGIANIPEGSRAEVVTDSQYAQKGMTEWIAGWKRKGWRTSAGQPVKNQDLWMALDAACSARKLRWTWVKGHSGHPGNERADELANEAIAARRSTHPNG